MRPVAAAGTDPAYFGVCNYEISIAAVDPTVRSVTLLTCGEDRVVDLIVDLIIALALLYFAITYILLLLKLKGYKKQNYTFVQVGLVYNTLQVSLNVPLSCILQMSQALPEDPALCVMPKPQ